MRLIDADAALNALTEYWDSRCRPPVLDGEMATYVDCKLIIKRQPTIDAVLVRCKDCKYSHMTYDGDVKYCDIWFPDEPCYISGEEYCSSGERREQDG